MRHLYFAMLLIFLANGSFAQTEKSDYKKVADKFENYFNRDNYDSIFFMFSSEMQKALPFDQTKTFLSNLKTQAGEITKRQFVKYIMGTYALYKTNFERALFSVNFSLDNNQKINGIFINTYKDDQLPIIERNITPLKLPFKDEWTVVWGGDTKEQNYHVESPAQKNAFDLVITGQNGKSYKTDGTTNEDYYAFGKEILAPCDGQVVLVVDGIKDNKPGEMNPIYVPGNTVILKTANNEYLFFAHFKQHSIQVKEGQKVQQGQVLGLCGNSGNSSEPHIHFHIQNVENMLDATGVKCYFDSILVNGQMKTDYSPIQGDKIKDLRNSRN